jgi:N-acetylmuramoyl-L-alanine amidase
MRLALAILLVCFSQALARGETFTGEITAENINVRTDSTVTSPVICALNKGERVDVVLEANGWYRIKLPKKAPAYIKKDFVECIAPPPAEPKQKKEISVEQNPCSSAKLLNDRVNIRLKPSESAIILGMANKDDAVKVLAGEEGWYKIEPTDKTFGWVYKQFVTKIVVPSDTTAKLKKKGAR